MNIITNEFLYYGGIVLSAAAVAGYLIYYLVSKAKFKKLNEKLDVEYGKEQP